MIKNFSNKRQCYAFFKPFLFLLLFFSFSFANAQNSITGKVTDAVSKPLAKVSVSVKGKPGSGVTNDSGQYSIPASSGDILLFSSAEYQPEQVRVGSSNKLDLVMTQIMSSMNEVVVVGYGTTARKNLTTSISKIDPKQVPQAANSSVAQLVFGRAAGVQAVQQSAEPGGNINIAIRGRGAPLVVIDGIVSPYSPLEPGNSGIANELNGVRRGG
ncbi:MAG: carboxypeptidase-like regulatory domain-containing protein, partial [Chitinophagaceae bacterium]|nr:carboxypeptidase-like regulatory domain-containing protein [Chitinophagaceae bacterium]